MKRKFVIAAIKAAALVAAAFGCSLLVRSGHPVSKEEVLVTALSRPATAPEQALAKTATSTSRRQPIQTAKFIEAKRFATVWPTTPSPIVVRGKIVAGVVNHHFLAADFIARFFRELKSSAPETKRIVLISPDHFKAGRGPVSVHDRPYATPDGRLDVDTAFVDQLVASKSAVLEDGSMFEDEHGIGALAPFIKHEFPDVEILPLAISGKMDRGQAKAFGESLAGLVDDGTVVIISSDMSHYLPTATALRNDATTIAKFEAFDAGFFATAKDEYIDNGVAMVVLAGLFDQERLKPKFILLDHGISSDYVADKLSTTSYINGFWTK